MPLKTSTIVIAMTCLIVGGSLLAWRFDRPRGWVAASSYGQQWPLSVTAGQLRCLDTTQVVFVADGTTYAVNGAAKGSGRYKPIETIWIEGRSLMPLIQSGLKLC